MLWSYPPGFFKQVFERDRAWDLDSLGGFVLRDISVTDRKWFSIWFTATQNHLEKLPIIRNRKGENKRVSVEFLKSFF